MDVIFSEVVNSQISVQTIILVLLVSGLLGFLIALVYKVTFKGVSYVSSFLPTLIILQVTTAVVMLVIGSNLARAFGLVGALSIIRFRTPIKDPKDIGFIFMTLVLGMAVGTRNYHIALVSAVFMLGLVYILDFFKFGIYSKENYFLTVHMEKREFNEESLATLLGKYTSHYELSSISTSFSDDEMLRVTYKVLVIDKKKTPFLAEIDTMRGVSSVSLVSSDNYIMH